MNNLLGIYIPTYNRKKELEECLESLIPQMAKHQLPIYISDNSTDDTGEMVERLKLKYEYIFYKHFPGSAPFATGIKQALALGNTDYFWLLSDDDIIEPDAIDTIVKELENKFEFLQINNQPYSKDMAHKVGPPSINLSQDIIYAPGEHNKVLLTATNGYAGFMGSIISAKKDLDKVLNTTTVESPTFITTIYIFKAILGKRGKLISKPLIKYRMGGALGGRTSEVWLLGYPDTLEGLKPEYSDEAIRKSSKRNDLLLIVAVNSRDFPNNRDSIKDSINKSRVLNPIEKIAAHLIVKFYRPKPKI